MALGSNLVSLVQLGFGGLIAALALLSYLLMKQEGARRDRNPAIYEQLQRYSKYTLWLALIVILGGIVDGAKDLIGKSLSAAAEKEQRQVVTLSKQGQDCRENLGGLVGPEGMGRPVEQMAQVQRLTHSSCIAVMRQIEELEGRMP